MADKKIKVNELPVATPTLNDTLLGSNATKEYACKIEDLKTLIGGGGGGSSKILVNQEVTVTDQDLNDGIKLTLLDGAEIDENLWMLGLYDIRVNGVKLELEGALVDDSDPILWCSDYVWSGIGTVAIYDWDDGSLLDGVYFYPSDPGTYTVSISLSALSAGNSIVKPLLYTGTHNDSNVRTFTVVCVDPAETSGTGEDAAVAGIRVDSAILSKIATMPVVCVGRAPLITAYDPAYDEMIHPALDGLFIPIGWQKYASPVGDGPIWDMPQVALASTASSEEGCVMGLKCLCNQIDANGDWITANDNTLVLFPDDVELTVIDPN